MNIFEEAVIYATEKHEGMIRKMKKTPYMLHPMEVAQIISTMTTDLEIISAGLLHDTVEDTDATIEEIREKFGDRVADLVESETENKYPGEDPGVSWKRRKDESMVMLKNSRDMGVKMLWLADKLSNIRSIAATVTEKGDEIWSIFHQKDPKLQLWYYRSVAEILEMDLNRTGAYKEFIRHINEIWPGTFDSGKAKYKKYREYSVEGCKVIGKGAKGTVYKYDDELIIKVYNEKNTYKDIERENYLARQAFVAGIPTAISFGIVTVGNSYGSMFELLNSASMSELIARNQQEVELYADQMADIARQIHSTNAEDMNLPDYTDEVYAWINGGIAHEDRELTEHITKMIDELPRVKTMIHGDFHTGNVMMQQGEPLLIDMDRLSTCHPIVELCGVYMFYVAFGELDPDMIESFMGFTYDTSLRFYKEFMVRYMQGREELIEAVNDKAALLCYVRLVRRVYKKGTNLSEKDAAARDFYMGRIRELLQRVDSFDF